VRWNNELKTEQDSSDSYSVYFEANKAQTRHSAMSLHAEYPHLDAVRTVVT